MRGRPSAGRNGLGKCQDRYGSPSPYCIWRARIDGPSGELRAPVSRRFDSIRCALVNDRLVPGDNSLDPGIDSRAHNGEVMAFGNPNGGLRSGDLAHAAGVSPDTLRHYERLGILKRPPRTSNGYRVYSHDALDRVLLIQNALAVGFSLRELTSILSVRDRGGAPCRQVVELAAEKVLKLDEQIEQLTRLRNSLKQKVKEWNSLLGSLPKNGRAGLLESLGTKIDQNSTNERGAADENATGFLRTSDSGSCLRAKRNLVPNARSARKER